VDSEGRTIWIADAHRDDGKRFVVRSDECFQRFSNWRGSRTNWPFQPFSVITIIEVKPRKPGWCVFESHGVEPVFLQKDQAIGYAEPCARLRTGEIRIFDSIGNVERVIAFDDANRRL
jgi:hypothetical protein